MMPIIKYDRVWDKLLGASKDYMVNDVYGFKIGNKYTTIRRRYFFDEKTGRMIDKASEHNPYYKTGQTYQQVILGKPAFKALLFGIEIGLTGNRIQTMKLEDDVRYQGKVDEEWFKRVRTYKDAMMLHFKKLEEWNGFDTK